MGGGGGGGGVFLILSSKITAQCVGAPLPQPASRPCAAVAVTPNVAVPKAKVFDLIAPASTSKKTAFRLYILK